MFLVAHMLVMHVCASRMPWSCIKGSRMCIIVCHRYDGPPTAPTGDPSIARLPGAYRRMLFGMFVVLGLMQHIMLSLQW